MRAFYSLLLVVPVVIAVMFINMNIANAINGSSNLGTSALSATSSAPPTAATTAFGERSIAERKEWCHKMVLKYRIIPGRSFGDLKSSKHAKFLSYNCDEFYCKPHELRGKGVYKCEPIDAIKSNSSIATATATI